MQNQKGISTLIVIIIIIAVAVVAVGGVFAYQYFTKTAGLPVQSQQATEGWKTYNFNGSTYLPKAVSFKYPSDWNVNLGSSNQDVISIIITSPNQLNQISYSAGSPSSIITCNSLENNKEIPGRLSCKTVEGIPYFIVYQDDSALNVYNQIISTFKFTSQEVAGKGVNFNLKVANDLMNGYLDQYKLSSVANNKRLIDYKINNIVVEKFDETNKCFFFTVDYSVQAATKQTGWVAGNGIEGTDNWINNKAEMFNVIQEGNIYTIVGGGTGGAPEKCGTPDKDFTPFSLTI